MSTIYEPARILNWLDTTLTPLASGGAWEGVGPVNAVPPYIVYQLDAASDVAGVAGIRLWHSGLYLVKVTGPAAGAGFAALVTIADAIDAALQLVGDRTIGAASDGFLIRCEREGVIPIPPELVNGETWASLGALWRIQAKQL